MGWALENVPTNRSKTEQNRASISAALGCLVVGETADVCKS